MSKSNSNNFNYTSESPKHYNKRKIKERIAKEASKITIKYKGVEYDENKLIQISDSLYKAREDSKIENVPDISIDEDLSEEKKEELISWKTKMEANRWKSRQRSLRTKGKLDQYKIDSLNKLGMVWNPKEDEWEKKYLIFREYGLCDEIEEWVMDQRKSYNDNSISKENIDRLNAVKFPFKADKNEEFVFTTRSIWKLREKLQTKQRRIEREKEKKEGIYKDRRKNTSTVKLTKKEKEDRNEVSSFYNRKFHYCSDSFIYKLSEKEALDKLLQINKGESIYSGRLKYFLDSESEKFKSQGRKTPLWVRNFYSDINDDKLSSDQIYVQLSIFMSSKFSAAVRKKACIYMLKYISNRNLNNSNSFKEINYLISAYKKEKNTDELFRLKKYIEKYPILIELYQSKIDKIIHTFKP